MVKRSTAEPACRCAVAAETGAQLSAASERRKLSDISSVMLAHQPSASCARNRHNGGIGSFIAGLASPSPPPPLPRCKSSARSDPSAAHASRVAGCSVRKRPSAATASALASCASTRKACA
eukprot:scaffold22348_cov84-Phaeocystis_antarctica.AAC.1